MASAPEYTLMSWGANSYGQLALGHEDDVLLPTLAPKLVTSKLRQITGGGAHTMLLTEDGDVYSCGWNKHGQLGYQEKSLLPKLIPLLYKITKISCGWSHTLALTDKGTVLSWGSNIYGQLGFNNLQDINKVPQQLDNVFNGAIVTDIGAGLRHSAAITETGEVFTWGNGKKGQLGLGEVGVVKSCTPPQQVDGLKHCAKVSLGAYFSVVLTVNGDLYCWGYNDHGQCAVSLDHKIIKRPHLINGIPPMAELCCGWSHVIAITIHRRVYVWGRGDYGQLGTGCSVDQFQPTELPELQGLHQVACGSEHNIAINSSGQVISWGWNEHGMCGTGNQTNVLRPQIIKTLESNVPHLIGTSAGHSMVVVI